MTNIQSLREQRANIWDQMQKIMDDADSAGRALTAEEKQTYDRLENDLDAKGDEVARAERHEQKAGAFNKVEGPGAAGRDPGTPGKTDDSPTNERDEQYAKAFATYMRRGVTALDADQQRLLSSGFVEAPTNAAGEGTGSAGGYTVPPAFRNKLIEQMTFVAAMRQLAEVITTETGANLPWPTVDDTGNEGAIVGENTANSEQDFTFGQNSLDAYMYSSKIVRVSLQLLQDNAFNLESWLASALGRRIGRVQNRHYTVGTGTGQPDGVVTSASVGKQGATGQTTTVVYDDLIDLTDSIDPAYLDSGNARFMLSQTARKSVRKLKDGQNRPLWEPSVQAGVPDTLLGYGVSLNNYMPAPAASAKSILFGDIREAYVIRDVSSLAVLRLTERYADYFQVGFVAFQRSDGTLQNASAVKAYQNSAT